MRLVIALSAVLVITAYEVSAGTFNNRFAAPVIATQSPLLAKDAARKATEHPAFANAGKKAGVEIWRIEDFQPVPVPKSEYGKFYRGDSYIILKTSQDKKGNLSWDIHYWLGSQTTQDESGAAAILTVGLDDKFNGVPVQHRETEAHESAQFVANFQPAIRYLDGGHASGFSHVTTNAGATKRLFQIKGKRNVRVRQVDPSIASMNKGDCFILDVDHQIYVYVGEKAKNIEKLKAVSVANQIRDQDHNGRATITIIDSTAYESETEKFFKALGSGNRAAVPEESAGGDDQAFERAEESTVTLYEVSDASGALKSTPLPKPYKQEQLNTNECYILDTVSGTVYVWVGKQATQREKTEAMNKASQFLASKKYPSWVQVTRVPEGTEPAPFKQYFSTWRSLGELHSRIVRSISDEELYSADSKVAAKRAKIIAKSGGAREFMPDNGSGQITVYRIENEELKKVFDSKSGALEKHHKPGHFYQGDSYVIHYEYPGGHILYSWLGKDSSSEEKIAASKQTVQLDNKLNGKALLARIPQGDEPKHFLKVFKGRLVTLLGGVGTGYKSVNQRDNYDDGGVRLFRIHGTAANEDVRAEQVPEVASSINSDDAFILESRDKVYVWNGKGSSEAEKEEAKEYAKLVFGSSKKHEVIEDGSEPAEFWSLLGSEKKTHQPVSGLWREQLHKRAGVEPKLFEATVYSNGKVTFDEIDLYEQDDLASDDVYLVDTNETIYLWIGLEAPPNEKKAAYDIISRYLEWEPRGRHFDSVIAAVVKQGLEPQGFKKLFPKWDDQFWQKQKSYDEVKTRILSANSVY